MQFASPAHGRIRAPAGTGRWWKSAKWQAATAPVDPAPARDVLAENTAAIRQAEHDIEQLKRSARQDIRLLALQMESWQAQRPPSPEPRIVAIYGRQYG